MSDVEKVDIKLGRFSRNNEGNDQSENELNLDSESSRPQRNSSLTGEDFRSLLTNSREDSEITIETTRLINEEISNQMSKRLIEIKTNLDSQIQNAITTATTETEFPSEAEKAQETWENRPKRCFTQETVDRCLERVQ